MKKIIPILTLIFAVVLIGGCNKGINLEDYVTDLREEIYTAEGENFSLKIYYGYKETPFNNDGAVGTRINYLTVRLLGVPDTATEYTFTADIDGTTLNGEFSFNPVANALSAKAELNKKPPASFEITISSAASSQTLTAVSALPEGTISYKQALLSLEKNQAELINNYVSDGKFTAEIYLRVMIRNDKPYYYVGFAKNGKITALLVDGFNGDILAVKTVL